MLTVLRIVWEPIRALLAVPVRIGAVLVAVLAFFAGWGAFSIARETGLWEDWAMVWLCGAILALAGWVRRTI